MDWKNKLYFGDNLKILREYVPDAAVDLIYLDPPFNSSATYNVLFKENSGDHPLVPSSERRGIRRGTPLLAKEGKQGWLAVVGPGIGSGARGDRRERAAQAPVVTPTPDQPSLLFELADPSEKKASDVSPPRPRNG
jgi:hypothetical protein